MYEYITKFRFSLEFTIFYGSLIRRRGAARRLVRFQSAVVRFERIDSSIKLHEVFSRIGSIRSKGKALTRPLVLVNRGRLYASIRYNSMAIPKLYRVYINSNYINYKSRKNVGKCCGRRQSGKGKRCELRTKLLYDRVYIHTLVCIRTCVFVYSSRTSVLVFTGISDTNKRMSGFVGSVSALSGDQLNFSV